MTKHYQVLFVCLGNICRSPMAEAVFRQKVREAGLQNRIAVESAGTGNWHIGKPPHQGTRQLLKAKGISDEGIRASQVTREQLAQADLIIAMDDSNRRDLLRLADEPSKAAIVKMLSFHPEHKDGDVPDPYYTGNFAEVYELLDVACGKLLDDIRKRISA